MHLILVQGNPRGKVQDAPRSLSIRFFISSSGGLALVGLFYMHIYYIIYSNGFRATTTPALRFAIYKRKDIINESESETESNRVFLFCSSYHNVVFLWHII